MAVWRQLRREVRRRVPAINKIIPSAAQRKARHVGVPAGNISLNQLLDRDWYKQTFGLSRTQSAVDHFLKVGSSRCYAIRPELAGEDRRTLTPWGAELVMRLGTHIGAKPLRALEMNAVGTIGALAVPAHKKRRLAVVTASFGGIDRLVPIFPEWQVEADFFAFVDQSFDDAIGWTRVRSNFHSTDTRRHARFIKLHLPLYFSDYEGVLWIDSNILPCGKPNGIVKALGVEDVDFAAFKHPDRHSLLMEAAMCVVLGKEDPGTMCRYLKRLGIDDFTTEMPLFETNVMYLRPGVVAVKKLCAAWWREILRGSKRDQVSLPVAIANQRDLNWKFFDEKSARASAHFVQMRHEKLIA